MDGHCQLLESTRLDGIFSVLKVSYRAFGNSGLPREKVGGKLFCLCPDFFKIFHVDYSFVLAGRFMTFRAVKLRSSCRGYMIRLNGGGYADASNHNTSG